MEGIGMAIRIKPKGIAKCFTPDHPYT